MEKRRAVNRQAIFRFVLIMKLSFFLVLVFSTQAYSFGFAQGKINLSLKNVEIKKAISAIQKVSVYRFIYNDDILPKDKKVSIAAKEATIQQVLNDLFLSTLLTYTIMNEKLIVISSKDLVAAFPLSGTVRLRDQNGLVTVSAGIVVKETGTSNIAVTDAQGRFSLNASGPEASLEISHVGYRTTTVPINGRNTIEFVLEAAVEQLSDVVVTALGITRQKKSLTYSTQTLKGTDLSDSRQVNLTSAMSGKVAGLTINKTNSGPGGSNRIVFRGNRSFGGSNQPLIIVDGVRIDNDAKAFADVALFGGRDNGDGISNINPDDVESMTVLTGVSAAALYGSDAANGAIVITTKSGKQGKGVGIQFSSSATMEKPMLFPKMQNEYGQGDAGIYDSESENSWGAKMDGQQVTDWTGKSQSYSPQPNNAKDFFQTGTEFINSLAISSGTDRSKTYFSYTNTLSRGIIPNNGYKRNNFNLRQTLQLTDKLTVDVKANYIIEDIINRPISGAANRSVSTIYAMPRSLRINDIRDFETLTPDGELVQNYWAAEKKPDFQNPYWTVYRNLYAKKRNRIIGLASLKYQITPELSILARTSLDYYADNGEEKDYNDSYWLSDYVGQGNYVLSKESNKQFNNDVLLNFSKELSSTLRLSVNAGASIEKFHFERTTLNNQGLNAPNLFSTSNAVALSPEVFPYLPFAPIARTEKQSVYGSAQLAFKNYLFLDVTGRNDWTSTLPKQNRSYFFPSVGLSALVNDMVQLPVFVSYLKLRASYAYVGNGTGFNQLNPFFRLAPGGNNGFLLIDPTLRNSNLKPEETRSFEGGLDFSLFGNKLGAEVTFYKTNTINQTLSIPVPAPSGYSSRFINAGNIQNQGVELLVHAKPVDSRDFKWNINISFGRNVNKVIKLDDLQKKALLSSPQNLGAIVVEDGKKYGEIYTAGFKRDANGQVVVNNGLPINENDPSIYAGNYNPDWTGGISNAFQYKAWALSFLIDMRKGGVIISGTQNLMAAKGISERTLANRTGDFVIPNSVNEDGSKNTVAISPQDYWQAAAASGGEQFIYDATNIRLREAALSYIIPARYMNSSIVKGASLSLIGRNLFFLKNNKDGIDPESSLGTGNNQGIEYASIPTTRSLGLYLKLNF